MTKSKTIIQIFVLFCALLSLSGCWSAKPINNLAIINVMGVDQNEAGEVVVTTLIVKPSSLFAQTKVGGGGNDPNKFLIETATGKNIFEAMGKLSTSVSEQFYLGHLNVVIFGEKAARERMESALDFFKRENGFRPNIKLLVTKGHASDIIKISPEFNSTLGLEIQDMAESDRFSATKMVKDISQFMDALSSNITDPITGVLRRPEKVGIEAEGEKNDSQNQNDNAKKEQGTSENNGVKEKDKIPKVLSLQGTAAFKGGHLKGFLDKRETRGLLAIQGELQNENVVLDCGGKDAGTVGVRIDDTKSKLSPQFNEHNRKMSVTIQVEGDIREITCSNLNLDTNKIETLNKKLEKEIKKDALSTLNKAKKQWQTDIFGFGEAIYRKYPKKWNQLSSKWRKGEFKRLNVDLKVQANISRYGLKKEPSKANESR